MLLLVLFADAVDLNARNGWIVGFTGLSPEEDDASLLPSASSTSTHGSGASGLGDDDFTLIDVFHQVPQAFDFFTQETDDGFELIDYLSAPPVPPQPLPPPPPLHAHPMGDVYALSQVQQGGREGAQNSSSNTPSTSLLEMDLDLKTGLDMLSAKALEDSSSSHSGPSPASALNVEIPVVTARGKGRKGARKSAKGKKGSAGSTKTETEKMPDFETAMDPKYSLVNVRIDTSGLSAADASKLRKKKHNDVEKHRRIQEKATMRELESLVLPYLGNPGKWIKADIMKGAVEYIKALEEATGSRKRPRPRDTAVVSDTDVGVGSSKRHKGL